MGDDLDARRDAPPSFLVLGLGVTIAFFALVGWSARTIPMTSDAAARSSATRALLVPASGALFGAWVDSNGRWTGNAGAEAEVAGFEKQIGRRLDVDQHYYAWTDRFPSGLERSDLANGRIPMITWKGTSLAEVLSGRDDGMIRARARGVRALGRPVFLRWGWEMNGSWSEWGGASNGGAGVGPKRYIEAWRHIHDLFRQEGASNVAWVWSPNDSDVPSQPWNHWTRYYPGDAYVDWVGIDGFNWGTSQDWSSWRSLAEIIEPIYRDYAGRKPIMVSETGSARHGGSKAQWLDDARSSLEQRFPHVRAFVYFDAPGSPADWRVTTSATAGSAYKAWAHDPYFEGGRPANPPVGGVFVWPNPARGRAKIAFTLGGRSLVSIEVRDARGVVVRHQQTDAPWPSAGSFAVRWDGTDDQGRRLPPGWYTAVVTATDGSGASSHANCTFQVK
jgi:FlgD Ig-like domain/Glycosyl hydrolase family 26